MEKSNLGWGGGGGWRAPSGAAQKINKRTPLLICFSP